MLFPDGVSVFPKRNATKTRRTLRDRTKVQMALSNVYVSRLERAGGRWEREMRRYSAAAGRQRRSYDSPGYSILARYLAATGIGPTGAGPIERRPDC